MRNSLKIALFVLVLCGVFGAVADGVAVMEGDSVTLNPNLTQIQEVNKIKWWFNSTTLIAEAPETEITYSDRFRNRLQLNQTGSLTIKNIKTKHSGLYKLQIFHNTGSPYQEFSVTVYESPPEDAYKDEIKNVSVMEGHTVTLPVPQLHGDELIVWRFGDEGKLIGKSDIEAKSSSFYDGLDKIFSDRLQLDHQTGSLTITNTRSTDSGFYTVKISSSSRPISYKRFIVTVSGGSSLCPGSIAGIAIAILLVGFVLVILACQYYLKQILKPLISNLSKLIKKLPKTSKQLKQLSETAKQLKQLSKDCEKEFRKISGKESKISEKLKEMSEISERLDQLPEISEQLIQLSEDCENKMSEIKKHLKLLWPCIDGDDDDDDDDGDEEIVPLSEMDKEIAPPYDSSFQDPSISEMDKEIAPPYEVIPTS